MGYSNVRSFKSVYALSYKCNIGNSKDPKHISHMTPIDVLKLKH